MQGNARPIWLGLALIALLGAAGYYYWRRAEDPPAPGRDVTLHGYCLACKHEVTAHYTAGEVQPVKCPLCGERAVYSLCYCEKCKMRIVPVLEPAEAGGLPRMPMIRTCPRCGGPASAYAPYDEEQQQAALGPVPEWPPK
ncbi:MAG: hypothetical protein PVJ57_03240 [Phycisphaerae bacterium]|jgi:hypothetical protein